jgi:hypothetical protein
MNKRVARSTSNGGEGLLIRDETYRGPPMTLGNAAANRGG